MKYGKKLSREKKKEKIIRLMSGDGVFVYENNTDADLSLPKPSLEGFTKIGPRKRFKGDSYFMMLVKTPICLLKLIEEIKEDDIIIENPKPEIQINIEKKEDSLINNKGKKTTTKVKRKKKKAKKGSKTKMKEKLILDQPDVVTQTGKQEQTVEQTQEETQAQEEKLLTENPSGDIEIISE